MADGLFDPASVSAQFARLGAELPRDVRDLARSDRRLSERFSVDLGPLTDVRTLRGGQCAQLSTTEPKGADMEAKASKDLIRSTAVAIGAWLIVISAGVHEPVDAAGVVYVTYRIE